MYKFKYTSFKNHLKKIISSNHVIKIHIFKNEAGNQIYHYHYKQNVIYLQRAKEIKVGHKKQLPNKENYRKAFHEKLFE